MVEALLQRMECRTYVHVVAQRAGFVIEPRDLLRHACDDEIESMQEGRCREGARAKVDVIVVDSVRNGIRSIMAAN
jgi:hypothetical protein